MVRNTNRLCNPAFHFVFLRIDQELGDHIKNRVEEEGEEGSECVSKRRRHCGARGGFGGEED